MTHYCVQLRDQIFLKRYGFLSAAKIMGKNIVKTISKNQSGKYSQKILDNMLNNLPQVRLKLLQKENSENSKSNKQFDW